MGKASEYQPGKDYSRRELLQLAQELGWSVVKKGQKGKSGHVTWTTVKPVDTKCNINI